MNIRLAYCCTVLHLRHVSVCPGMRSSEIIATVQNVPLPTTDVPQFNVSKKMFMKTKSLYSLIAVDSLKKAIVYGK